MEIREQSNKGGSKISSACASGAGEKRGLTWGSEEAAHPGLAAVLGSSGVIPISRLNFSVEYYWKEGGDIQFRARESEADEAGVIDHSSERTPRRYPQEQWSRIWTGQCIS